MTIYADNEQDHLLISDLLLQTDGTTTRTIEIIVRNQVNIHVYEHERAASESVPEDVRQAFPANGQFIRRLSSLTLPGRVLSYNIVYANLLTLPADLARQLDNRQFPLGKLLAEYPTRREITETGIEHRSSMEAFAPYSLNTSTYLMKKYKIIGGDSCWFYLIEYFDLDAIVRSASRITSASGH
ncbi:chorismate pyruvate-lyase family protein [Paenibacillus chitinolyticus]|uniref:chorismate pyruvate-lyase family protein n=1 Tax=Paenibacillus chitinolyticus TaxID=79263 RepID=UPI002DB84108|nr:chorismate pyruvate-lyase family protein [Paenibacillus chitinolyticus]MEC0244268.1 chorismate pyruvate-lyase family protein [Paenibacillus chitinolyticus]